MEVPRLAFRESLLSPWAERLGSRRTLPEGASPRFSTVGSLDAVNAQVAVRGLQPRALLPDLVVDTFQPEPCPPSLAASDMPPRRRAARAAQTKHSRKPRSEVRPRVKTTMAKLERSTPRPRDLHPSQSTAEELEDEATLIELATFPGYTPSRPTPLPHSLETLDQMRRVTRAQAKLAAKREGYREYWRQNFYSTASQTIFLDTFWWFFLEKYQSHKAVQSSLFSRVAENYVTFLANTEVHTWRDKFLKAYPDALAQCVYTAFIHAFPASWGSFDDDFKSALVEVVYLWQTGTRPMPQLWRRWNFKYLEPPDSLKTIGQEEEPLQRRKSELSPSLPSSLLPRLPLKAFDLDALVEEARGSISEEVPPITEEDGDSESSEYHSLPVHPSPPSQKRVSRAELERVLSGSVLQDDILREDHGGRHIVRETERGESSVRKMDVARSQYLSLRQKKTNDRGRLQSGGKPQVKPFTSQATQLPPPGSRKLPTTVGSSHISRQKPEKETTPSTLWVPKPPPLPPRTPRKTAGSHSGLPPQPHSDERPRGSLKPCSAEEEMRGGSHPPRPNKACRKKVKGAQSKGKTQPSPATQKKTPSTESKSQASATPPAGDEAEKPAGSCKPVSAAQEYGLPNYVFEEGESSWKEKAITARDKRQQKPINVLRKLHHHQGVPLAVPEMESVCFNQCGRSPLVKHYLQKRRLNKVTGYAILTKRTELNQVIPSGAPTYDEVIKESLRESREQTVHLNSQKRQSRKQLQGILQERVEKRDQYKRQLRQLLSAQKEVESLSNELVVYWQQRGVDKQQGVASLKRTLSPDMQHTLSSCINQAFQRCSTHPSP